jgi:hypothetical protein
MYDLSFLRPIHHTSNYFPHQDNIPIEKELQIGAKSFVYFTQVDRSFIVFWILSRLRQSTVSEKLRNTEQCQENGQLKYFTRRINNDCCSFINILCLSQNSVLFPSRPLRLAPPKADSSAYSPQEALSSY